MLVLTQRGILTLWPPSSTGARMPCACSGSPTSSMPPTAGEATARRAGPGPCLPPDVPSARRLDHERLGDHADLDGAVERLAEGLMLLSPNSPEAAAFHYRLSVAFLHRADRHELEGLDTCADLNRAVDAARRAADAAMPDSPLVPGWLDGLARARRARWEATGSRAKICARRVGSFVAPRRRGFNRSRHGPASSARGAAWGISRSTWNKAADATRLAVAALRALVSTQLMRGDKETCQPRTPRKLSSRTGWRTRVPSLRRHGAATRPAGRRHGRSGRQAAHRGLQARHCVASARTSPRAC